MPGRRLRASGSTLPAWIGNDRRMPPELKTFVARSPREVWILVQAIVAVTSTRFALRILPLSRIRRTIWRVFSAERPLPVMRRCSQDQVIRAVVSAGKHSPIGTTCLATALVGQALLHRHGYIVELRLGVRRDSAGKFAAHAWLERQGTVVLGGPTAVVRSYSRFPEMEHLIR
jgi:hypothetical protein